MIRDTAHASRADASSVGRARVRWPSMNGSWAWAPIASSSSVRRSPGTVRIVTDSASAILPSHAPALFLPPPPIAVIRPLALGTGVGPAVIEASRLANLGASARDVHERVVALLARTHAFVLVESLEPLRRSGRIGRVQELVGTLIDAHPILTLDQGEARLVETVRSRRRALLRLCDLAQELAAIEMLLTCGTSVESIAEMDALLAERYTGTIQKTWLGPAIGANLGPAIAVAVVVRE